MVEVKLFCKEFKYNIEQKCAHDVFEPYRLHDIAIAQAFDFMDNQLPNSFCKTIKGHAEAETNKYAQVESELKTNKVVHVNCDDQPCKTFDLRTKKSIPPKHKSGYIAHATHGQLQIKINCPNFVNCGACYAMLESGKCTDKLVMETIGKTFFTNKYDKQR